MFIGSGFGVFDGFLSDTNESISNQEVLINASAIILDSFYKNKTTTVFMIVSAESESVQYMHHELSRKIMISQDCNISFAVETNTLDNKLFRRFFSFFVVENYNSFRYV